MSLDNSLLVACGGEVTVAAARITTAMGDVAAMDDVVVVVGAVAVVAVWVQRC